MTSFFTLFAAVADECTKNTFFGLRPWWYYLPNSRFDGSGRGECNVKDFKTLGSDSDIPLVLLAVVDDLLRIAGIVAIAFVIVGAIRMITSQGQPEDVAKGRDTVINALIGLVVAVIAIGFVGFVGNKLGG